MYKQGKARAAMAAAKSRSLAAARRATNRAAMSLSCPNPSAVGGSRERRRLASTRVGLFVKQGAFCKYFQPAILLPPARSCSAAVWTRRSPRRGTMHPLLTISRIHAASRPPSRAAANGRAPRPAGKSRLGSTRRPEM